MNTTRVRSFICIVICVFATAVPTSGCGGNSTEAKKLDAPEGIDWEAIEAEGSQINEEQSLGE